MQKSIITCDSAQWAKWQFLSTVIDDLIQKPLLVTISEKGLFTLLQYSYGIRRTGTDATILLNEKATEKITVAPLLMKVLNKYREHERIEQ